MAVELEFFWWAEFRPVTMRYDGGHLSQMQLTWVHNWELIPTSPMGVGSAPACCECLWLEAMA